ncbi:MAG: NAD-dependent epimerase/dehydratase family protein [Candidatus Omnitrophica bacterium]|nr:NAD-dependent epimerase/dehydratase family protein [Candidatus Omnitrophota bacterium]
MTTPSHTARDAAPPTVLVFGGAGYLGSVLTGQLLEAGYRVRVFDRLLFGEEALAGLRTYPNLEMIQADMRDRQRVMDALQGVAAVILLAALVGDAACDRDPQETREINYVATVAIAEACAAQGIPRFLFASTDSAYGIQEGVLTEEASLKPISLYACLKAEAERKILALTSEPFAPCVLRMATIYGLSPRMRFDLIVNILTMHAATRGTCTVYGGKQWRPLVHVADAARAYILALGAPADLVRGHIFNVGSNEQNYQIYQLGDIVKRTLPGITVETTDVPPDLRDYHVSFDKIHRMFGYRVSYSVEDGVREMYQAILMRQIEDPFAARYRNA